MANTRFNGTILHGNSKARKWFNDMPQAFVGPEYVEQWYDFVEVADDETNLYTVVKDSGASVAIAADTANGRLLLTSAATTDNDGASIQGNEIWLPAAGRTIWFETRLQVSTAADMDVYAGLTVNFATNPEAVLAAADRIGFQINEADASILCKTEAGGTETSTDSGVDAVNATDVILGFKVIGTTQVEFYVNRNLVATHTTNIPTTELTFGFCEISGTATGTLSMSIDYIGVWGTR
jgi:hypothetical protein